MKRVRIVFTSVLLGAVLALVSVSPAALATSHEGTEFEDKPTALPAPRAKGDDGIDTSTGTDPRDFAPKFMPYYRYS